MSEYIDDVITLSLDISSEKQAKLLSNLFKMNKSTDFTCHFKTTIPKDTAMVISELETSFLFRPKVATKILFKQLENDTDEAKEHLNVTIRECKITYPVKCTGYQITVYNDMNKSEKTETRYILQIKHLFEKLIEHGIQITWRIDQELRKDVWKQLFINGVVFRVVIPEMSKDISDILPHKKSTNEYILSELKTCFLDHEEFHEDLSWTLEACGPKRVVHDFEFRGSTCTMVTPIEAFEKILNGCYSLEVIEYHC